jgi:DNA-binding GntR family transcriptional regulator
LNKTASIGDFEWRLHAPRSNATLAYERLRTAIVSGQFDPGQRITEVGIASLLGVSRTPVREAFLRLITDGLLRSSLSGGIEVVDLREESADIQMLREAVEGCAARLAALRATEAEITLIGDLATESSKTDPAHLPARARLNERFHLAIAEAAHAPRVERLVRDYRSLFASPERLGRLEGGKTKRLLTAHLGIAEAIRRRDPDDAEAKMRQHLRDLSMAPVA